MNVADYVRQIVQKHGLAVRSYWTPGQSYNQRQLDLLNQGARLSLIALAADNPPTEQIAHTYDTGGWTERGRINPPEAPIAAPARPEDMSVYGSKREDDMNTLVTDQFTSMTRDQLKAYGIQLGIFTQATKDREQSLRDKIRAHLAQSGQGQVNQGVVMTQQGQQIQLQNPADFEQLAGKAGWIRHPQSPQHWYNFAQNKALTELELRGILQPQVPVHLPAQGPPTVLATPQPGQVPQMPGQPGQAPQMPGQVGQVPQMPGQVGQVPQMPGQVPQVPGQVPQMPGQVGQIPQMPGQGQISQMPGQGQISQMSGQVDQIPQMPSQGQVPQMPGQGQVPQMPGQPGLNQYPETGLLCSVCREKQFKTLHGDVCKNGHGGAEPIAPGDQEESLLEQATIAPGFQVCINCYPVRRRGAEEYLLSDILEEIEDKSGVTIAGQLDPGNAAHLTGFEQWVKFLAGKGPAIVVLFERLPGPFMLLLERYARNTIMGVR